jgi:hypothetical protein
MVTIRKTMAGAVLVGAALAMPSTALAATNTAAGPAAPAGKPAGCGTAHFCSYQQGNGGSICYNTATTYIAAWSAKCQTVDSVFNNGASAGVRLYYLTNAGGADYCLGNTDYLLYMTQNTFDEGSGKSGYGQPMGNHVKSSRFGGGC